MLGYYSKLSTEVYGVDKPVGSSFGDVEFYMERLDGVTGRILEPATGTGRMLVPLFEHNFVVDGFDSSKDMLKVCRKNCEQRGLQPNLFEADMETFDLNTEYEAIIIPAGTFLLLHERQASLKALKNFHRHLKPGGKLIVDLYLPTDSEVGHSTLRSWEIEGGGVITLETTINEIDHINQFSVAHNRYEKWRRGKLLDTELERFAMRWYGVEEFRTILENHGFRDIVISADYAYGKYPDSPKQSITFEAFAEK
ncbi:class I SAM-dependent methyltransferase [Planococcus salinarum]|uniref:class I SAM-dependent methyltransferase n=1 Tax=Planococcus salinarum TaxID=622695 RepID=UPI000E3DE0F9|nr:class I SAM-dependent methyltransferase [Planococcus salinarum]TAA71698.1 class I SAM-dependent methyltransferase [Planococcus salinarum]